MTTFPVALTFDTVTKKSKSTCHKQPKYQNMKTVNQSILKQLSGKDLIQDPCDLDL
jgi:hypothetical protein